MGFVSLRRSNHKIMPQDLKCYAPGTVWRDQKFEPGPGPGQRPGPEIGRDRDRDQGPGLGSVRNRVRVWDRDHDKEWNKDLW